MREDWERIKIDVMRELLVQKFHTEPLRLWLLQTGNVSRRRQHLVLRPTAQARGATNSASFSWVSALSYDAKTES